MRESVAVPCGHNRCSELQLTRHAQHSRPVFYKLFIRVIRIASLLFHVAIVVYKTSYHYDYDIVHLTRA